MNNPQRIRLLVLPLKVRISGVDETLEYKRLEVWILLLKVFKEKAIDAVHSFSTGFFSVNLGSKTIWKVATEVLLEILGKFSTDDTLITIN